VGRIVYEKGIHVLLDAWARLAGQVRGRLVIAGIGPHLEMCEAQARALGLNDRVLFAGKISDAERDRFYHAADVAVFPSLYEPFGIVALEAMAAACPVVVTQTGGLQEIVRPHETGITVPPDHIDALAWGILHTLQHPNWAQARAHNALDDLRTLYSWQHVAQEQSAIYRQLQTSQHLEAWSVDSCAPPEQVLA
jgi:glycosyltransferase involved in cell wall biosynthesis